MENTVTASLPLMTRGALTFRPTLPLGGAASGTTAPDCCCEETAAAVGAITQTAAVAVWLGHLWQKSLHAAVTSLAGQASTLHAERLF